MPSYFRAYTEPHHIDIDLRLQENGTVVAQNIKFNEEEVLVINFVFNIAYIIFSGDGIFSQAGVYLHLNDYFLQVDLDRSRR